MSEEFPEYELGEHTVRVWIGDDGTLDTIYHWECSVCDLSGTERFSHRASVEEAEEAAMERHDAVLTDP